LWEEKTTPTGGTIVGLRKLERNLKLEDESLIRSSLTRTEGKREMGFKENKPHEFPCDEPIRKQRILRPGRWERNHCGHEEGELADNWRNFLGWK